MFQGRSAYGFQPFVGIAVIGGSGDKNDIPDIVFCDQMLRQVIHSGIVVHNDIDRIGMRYAMADHGDAGRIAAGDQIIHHTGEIAKIGYDDGSVKVGEVWQTEDLELAGPVAFGLTVGGITQEQIGIQIKGYEFIVNTTQKLCQNIGSPSGGKQSNFLSRHTDTSLK